MHYAYEDLTPGLHLDLGDTTIDRADMLAFNRRFDPQPFHTDDEAGRASIFGGLCASGWYTCALWMRAYVDAVLADSTSLGSPGGSELAWEAPVFPGDRLAFDLEVRSARRSASREGMGLVEITGHAKRDDAEVLRMTFTGLFGTRT